MVFGVSVFGHIFLRALNKRIGALFRPLGSREPLLRPRWKTQHYVVIGVRSGALLGQNGPGIREWCTFSKSLFLVVFENQRYTSCFAFPWGLLGLSGHPLGGPRGPNNQSKVTATLRPVLGRVLRLRAGSRGSPRPRNTTYRCAESLRRDRCVFKTLVKHEGLEPFWHPRGPNHEENACLSVFFVPRRLPKNFPEGHEHKTLVNNDRIWGVFLVFFSCPLRFLSRGSGFLCGAVLAAPSVP